jgi:hypothetical protein
MSNGKTGQVVVVFLVLVALFACLMFLPSPVRENSPDQANAQAPPPGSCVVTQVTDVTEFLELASSSGAGFRYSGAPLAVTLDIHIKKFPSNDFWDDPNKMKEIFSSLHDDDQVLAYSSCSDNRIEKFESGRMGDEEKNFYGGLGQQGKLLLQFPSKWWSSQNQTFLILESTADIEDKKVEIATSSVRTSTKSKRISLADKFPDPDAIVDTVHGGAGVQPFIEKSVTIAPGETASLFHFQGLVSFGDNSDRPAFLMTCSLSTRCLRPPVETATEAK